MVFLELFDVNLFLTWLACIVKKKEKVFDLLGTSLESEQDQARSRSMKINEDRKSLQLAACS